MEAVDEDPTRAHRIRYLMNLRVDAAIACTYADQVDPHEVERLVDEGCPPNLAIEILRP